MFLSVVFMPNNLPTAADIACRHLIVSGQVQGVYYRASMVEEAQRLGVKGWVRNRLDGTVESQLQGDGESVAMMIAWARRGPAAATVSNVLVELAEAGDYLDFQAIATA